MKRRLVLYLLTAVLSLGTFAACKNDDNNKDKGYQSNTELLFGFDSYEEVQSFKLFGDRLGRSEVNTDEDFITQGEASLHVEPVGIYESINGYPFFLMDATSDYFATSDFSSYTGIVMDVYNDSEADTTITVRLGVAGKSGATEDTPAVKYNLPKKEWTRVLYDFSDGSMKYNFQNLQLVDEIYVQFDDYKRSPEDRQNSLYFDNLRGIKGESAAYEKKVENGVLLDFEDNRDINLFDYRTFTFSRSYDPMVSVNYDGSFVTRGKRSLEVLVEYKYVTHLFIHSPNPDRVMTAYTANFGDALNGKTVLCVDVINANSFNTTIRYFYDFNSSERTYSVTLAPYEKRTVTMEVGDFSKVTKFGFKFQPTIRADELFYFDNFRVA